MPRIAQFFGIILTMYYEDHNPPHFHAEYGEYEAEVLISDGSIHEGELPRRAKALVFEWWGLHQDELAANWERCRAKQRPLPIAPLE
jgi:hypothetical protein